MSITVLLNLEKLKEDLSTFDQVLTSSCFLPEGWTSVGSALTQMTCQMMSSPLLTFAVLWLWTGTQRTTMSTGQMLALTQSAEQNGMDQARRYGVNYMWRSSSQETPWASDFKALGYTGFKGLQFLLDFLFISLPSSGSEEPWDHWTLHTRLLYVPACMENLELRHKACWLVSCGQFLCCSPKIWKEEVLNPLLCTTFGTRAMLRVNAFCTCP